MPRPLVVLDSIQTPDGLLELRRRGEREFMILISGRVLMSSTFTTSELALATQGCRAVAHLPEPRVLIGGLGLGFTLQAALKALPPTAHVAVAELNAKIVDWCRGPVASVNGAAALDLRVHLILGDVLHEVRRVAENAEHPRYDAILWDLYLGPRRAGGSSDALYGDASLSRARRALRAGGVFGVWGENPSPAFEARLRKHGFTPELIRTQGAGLKHAVYIATAGDSTAHHGRGIPPSRPERKPPAREK